MIEISKWSETFENADSRKRQRLGFFYMPSGCDSSGYLALMSEFSQKDALMAMGIFMALCQVAATGRKEERGRFIKGDGSAMSTKQVAMLIRCQEAHLIHAVNILADERVKWLVCHQSADDLPPICQSSATSVPLNSENSSIVQGQGQGQGQGEDSSASTDAGMSISDKAELIWKEYPRKLGKEKAIAAIKRALKTIGFTELLDTVKTYAIAKKDTDKQYIPHGSTWFCNKGFNDDQSEWSEQASLLPKTGQDQVTQLRAEGFSWTNGVWMNKAGSRRPGPDPNNQFQLSQKVS